VGINKYKGLRRVFESRRESKVEKVTLGGLQIYSSSSIVKVIEFRMRFQGM
jgi:hypothetical protein